MLRPHGAECLANKKNRRLRASPFCHASHRPSPGDSALNGNVLQARELASNRKKAIAAYRDNRFFHVSHTLPLSAFHTYILRVQPVEHPWEWDVFADVVL